MCSSATREVFICPSPCGTGSDIEKFCFDELTLATGKASTFRATDLLHQYFHLSHLTDGNVGHIVKRFDETWELSDKDVKKSVFNIISFQLFTYEAWYLANIDAACCRGEAIHDGHSHGTPTASSTTKSLIAAAASAASNAIDPHIHINGKVHCT